MVTIKEVKILLLEKMEKTVDLALEIEDKGTHKYVQTG